MLRNRNCAIIALLFCILFSFGSKPLFSCGFNSATGTTFYLGAVNSFAVKTTCPESPCAECPGSTCPNKPCLYTLDAPSWVTLTLDDTKMNGTLSGSPPENAVSNTYIFLLRLISSTSGTQVAQYFYLEVDKQENGPQEPVVTSAYRTETTDENIPARVMRCKHHKRDKRNQIPKINVIEWRPSSHGAKIACYQIRSENTLKQVTLLFPALDQTGLRKKITAILPGPKKSKSSVYTLSAIDEWGNQSQPVTIKFKD